MAKKSAQDFLEIDQIREGVVLLKNRALRGILMVSSLNFALKSEEEQNAILYQFQNFLNSLDFSCQIIIQSRKLNITGYLDKLKDLEKNQNNELLKTQTAEYRKFIKGLVKEEAVMTKSFYVVVPFSMGLIKKPGAQNILTEDQFQRGKAQLWQRIEFIVMGLRRCGLRAIPLTTLELIEFFWTLHHPEEAEVGYHPEFPPELSI